MVERCDKCHQPTDGRGTVILNDYNGTCDECGAVVKLPAIMAKYIYDDDGKHVFRAITHHRCPGCFTPIFAFQVYCGGLNITAEMRSVVDHA